MEFYRLLSSTVGISSLSTMYSIATTTRRMFAIFVFSANINPLFFEPLPQILDSMLDAGYSIIGLTSCFSYPSFPTAAFGFIPFSRPAISVCWRIYFEFRPALLLACAHKLGLLGRYRLCPFRLLLHPNRQNAASPIAMMWTPFCNGSQQPSPAIAFSLCVGFPHVLQLPFAIIFALNRLYVSATLTGNVLYHCASIGVFA